MQGFLKEWMFARMNMLTLLGELKRLQVQVALLRRRSRLGSDLDRSAIRHNLPQLLNLAVGDSAMQPSVQSPRIRPGRPVGWPWMKMSPPGDRPYCAAKARSRELG